MINKLLIYKKTPTINMGALGNASQILNHKWDVDSSTTILIETIGN